MPKPYELQCEHNIGHSQGVHGCDGCCEVVLSYHTADLGTRYRYRTEGRQIERNRIVALIENTYHNTDKYELGSFVWTTDIIELIQKNQDTDLQENLDE